MGTTENLSSMMPTTGNAPFEWWNQLKSPIQMPFSSLRMQPKIRLAFWAMRAHFWLMPSFPSTSTPRSFMAETWGYCVLYWLNRNPTCQRAGSLLQLSWCFFIPAAAVAEYALPVQALGYHGCKYFWALYGFNYYSATPPYSSSLCHGK